MSSEKPENMYAFGPFLLDERRLVLFEGRKPVALGPKVVQTLLALIERPGNLCTKAELLDRIWPEGCVSEGNLSQNVHVLRKTLRAWSASAIETVPRRGYRFTQPVERRRNVPSRFQAHRFRRPAVAAALALTLAALVMMPFSSARSPAAMTSQQLYAVGHYYWDTRTPAGIEKSLHYFTLAIDADPSNARNYAAMAAADALMADYNYGSATPATYYARARAYARQALALDPGNSDAYAVTGVIATTVSMPGSEAFERGLRDLRRAIALDPHSAPAHQWYGCALLDDGLARASYRELRIAIAIDPLSVGALAWISDAALQTGHFEEAIAYARETLELSRDRNDVLESLGLAYEARGNDDRAIAEFRRMTETNERAEGSALLSYVYAHTHRDAQARRALAVALMHRNDVNPENLAVALDANGSRTMALAVLRRMPAAYLRERAAYDRRFAALRPYVFSRERSST